jgi:hypothetical protein
VTQIGPIGVIPNGASAYAELSNGSGTLYLENNGSLDTINTTTGAGTLVGTETGSYSVYALPYEDGAPYVGSNGFGIGTVNVSTGQIMINSPILGGPNFLALLRPPHRRTIIFPFRGRAEKQRAEQRSGQ